MSDRQSRVVMTIPANAGRRLNLAATPEPNAKPAAIPFDTVGGSKYGYDKTTKGTGEIYYRVRQMVTKLWLRGAKA